MISQESKKEMLKNFAEGSPAKHLTNDLYGDFDGDHTDKHLACSAYDFRPSVRLRKNSNADNEKDGV